MRAATPLQDGSLEVSMPDAFSVYAMGNRRLFATLDGSGGVSGVVTTDSVYLGHWMVDIYIGGRPVAFRRARALGRLWELEGEAEGVHFGLTSFVSGDAALFQQCRLENKGPQKQPAMVRIRWSTCLPLSRWKRWIDRLARWVPRVTGQTHLWGEGWAKVFLPAEVRLQPQDKRVEARGLQGQQWFWEGCPAPHHVNRTNEGVLLEYTLEVPAGGTTEIVWGVGPKSELPAISWSSALESAWEYARWLQHLAPSCGDALVRSLVVAGVNAAVSAFKVLEEDFAGFTAGPDYFYPPRLYFRDGYWTAQVVLPHRPDLVRCHLLSLARGVHPDGRCPSGVFPPGLFGTVTDWLPDHLDSPAFFVLLLADYLRFTGDWDILQTRVGDRERSLWETAQRALAYLCAQDRDGDGLLEKPRQPNDWADNVRRSGWVTYDQALYVAALRAGAVIAARTGQNDLAAWYQRLAERAREAMDRHLWLPDKGHYINYLSSDRREANLSIDTILIAYFRLTDEDKIGRLLAAARRLQTRFNEDQPFGDWGVMCVFPPYRYREDLFGKSAHPYCYHNGADWPYWDGVYGAVLREREDEDAYYVLTRWWAYGLEKGWLTPVEYYSPAYPEGGMLQGWSSMPAAALLPPHVWTTPSQFLEGNKEAL